MSDRAFVQPDFFRMGVSIYLVQKVGDQRFAVGQPVELVMREEETGAVGIQQEPTLRLPESMARALLDALSAHFGGTGDMQTLRKDYLAERVRVDKMIDHLTTRTSP
jgi:hypothetical protein